MGLFAPKISAREAEYVRARLVQLNDSVKLLNTTNKPDVFFKRLHFTLDLLLELKSYEKYKIFKGSTPTSDYNKIISNMEAIVDDFIDRAIQNNQQKILTLKTESAKERNFEKFNTSLIAAFDCANTFWSGNTGRPHYTGPLYTSNNYHRVNSLFNAPSYSIAYSGEQIIACTSDDEMSSPATQLDTFCRGCGAKFNDDAHFCMHCGTKRK